MGFRYSLLNYTDFHAGIILGNGIASLQKHKSIYYYGYSKKTHDVSLSIRELHRPKELRFQSILN